MGLSVAIPLADFAHLSISKLAFISFSSSPCFCSVKFGALFLGLVAGGLLACKSSLKICASTTYSPYTLHRF